jgi:hypothetical protein
VDFGKNASSGYHLPIKDAVSDQRFAASKVTKRNREVGPPHDSKVSNAN